MIKNPINQGTNTSTTLDWLNTTREMKLTAVDPSVSTNAPLIEPGQAINLPASERARMNRALPGVETRFERL
jgi:hypothetical protein